MALTPNQLQILADDIESDPTLSQIPETEEGAWTVAQAYNLNAVPNYWVWRTMVLVNELTQGAGFDWTRVDNLTVGKARIWEFMIAAGQVNPSLANVRSGYEACFSVEAADQGTRQAIYNQSQRLATRGEKLYAAGSGTPSTHHGVGPAVMSFEGNITYHDVLEAWLLP